MLVQVLTTSCVQGGEVHVSNEQKIGELTDAIKLWLEACDIDSEEERSSSDEDEPARKRAKQAPARPRQRRQLALALRQEYTQNALQTQGRGALKGDDKARAELLLAALERVRPRGFRIWIVEVRLLCAHACERHARPFAAAVQPVACMHTCLGERCVSGRDIKHARPALS